MLKEKGHIVSKKMADEDIYLRRQIIKSNGEEEFIILIAILAVVIMRGSAII